jgi:hypothetical protein
MSYEAKGTLHHIGETRQVSDTFSTRTFTICQQDDKYPQFISFELHKDRTDLIDSFKVGDDINVSFNLRGREWNGKFFNTIQAWRIQKVTEEESDPF